MLKEYTTETFTPPGELVPGGVTVTLLLVMAGVSPLGSATAAACTAPVQLP